LLLDRIFFSKNQKTGVPDSLYACWDRHQKGTTFYFYALAETYTDTDLERQALDADQDPEK
jgi:hypothetical protein